VKAAIEADKHPVGHSRQSWSKIGVLGADNGRLGESWNERELMSVGTAAAPVAKGAMASRQLSRGLAGIHDFFA
jgi:hypothetical protein